MAALIPVTQPTNVEAAYEDMFKEITRKLYGEETGNGLHTLGTPVAHVATSGPTAPEGERSFTTLMSDRSLAPTIEYDHNAGSEASANNFKTEDHLTTAFGLAALMQNGFPPSSTILNTHNLSKVSSNVTTTVPATTSGSNTANNTTAGTTGGTSNSLQDQQRWPGTNEEIIPWSGTGKMNSFNNQQKASKSSKARDQSNEMFADGGNNTTTNRKNKNQNSNHNSNAGTNSNQVQVQKRYSCGHCPYSTDRRDLFTRHENIHKDEKPFQCYACLKQFNRADHVKKHFLRMHRELAYDINKTRRSVSNDQKPIFAHNSNNQSQLSDSFMTTSQRNSGSVQDNSLSIAQTIESVATAQLPQHPVQLKQEKSPDEKSTVKVKREKRFTCCYCPWSGADKWGLKRHLNTHTKPFVCMLCDYKAARSERLATHVLKVHNKKACNKCSFLADNQEEYQAHVNEVHQLKMDAISRNTASVAQDFHNAGGVEQNLRDISSKTHCSTDNHVGNNNNNYRSSILPAAATLNLNNNENMYLRLYQKKAMSNSNDESDDQQHLKLSPPAYTNSNKITAKGHRLALNKQDKENSNSIFANMEYNNYSALGIQFQDYVRVVINKYYAETPLLYPNEQKSVFGSKQPATSSALSPPPPSAIDTKDYLEYLKNKNDITLIINGRKNCSENGNIVQPAIQVGLTPVTTTSNKRQRKQAKPKKVMTSKDIVSLLRDKYMKRLVDRKLSCIICTNIMKKRMLVFPYHSPGSLVLHNMWRHSPKKEKCKICNKVFFRNYSLRIHRRTHHRTTES